MQGAIADGQERVQGYQLTMTVHWDAEVQSGRTGAVGNSGCSQVKSRRGKGGQEVLPRVGSSVIHLQLEGIWAVYSICIKNKDLVTP